MHPKQFYTGIKLYVWELCDTQLLWLEPVSNFTSR